MATQSKSYAGCPWKKAVTFHLSRLHPHPLPRVVPGSDRHGVLCCATQIRRFSCGSEGSSPSQVSGWRNLLVASRAVRIVILRMCNLLRNKPGYDEAHETFETLRDVRMLPSAPRFKIAPSEEAPVVRIEPTGMAKVAMMRFGFKSGKGGRQLMARGETVGELRMFKDAFKHRRCLVLAHGFYDSEDMGRYKQPWHIHLKTDGLMAFAALWEEVPDAENFTIVSSPANAVVARVIDRMPVILPRDSWWPWLEPTTSRETLESMMTPYPAELMEAYPVTRKVNQPGFEGPECVERIVPEQADLGLF